MEGRRKIQRYDCNINDVILVVFILLVRVVFSWTNHYHHHAHRLNDGGRGVLWIPDDDLLWETPAIQTSRCYPAEYEGHFSQLMIPHDEIRNRVRELAEILHKDYEGSRPVMICTLKGACPFYQHLLDEMQKLKHGYTMEFLRASSYVGTATSGNVKVLGDALRKEDIQNRHVILVEDIVDTGTTLANLLPKLKTYEPKTLEVCTLLEKRLDNGAQPVAKAKYSGFSIPNKFIIGYGLDYNELYRDLPDIWVISSEGITFDANTLS